MKPINKATLIVKAEQLIFDTEYELFDNEYDFIHYVTFHGIRYTIVDDFHSNGYRIVKAIKYTKRCKYELILKTEFYCSYVLTLKQYHK